MSNEEWSFMRKLVKNLSVYNIEIYLVFYLT